MKIGIFGAGQLGRMLATAAIDAGDTPILFSDVPSESCASIARNVHSFESIVQNQDLIHEISHWTYEFENIPHELFEALPSSTHISPPVKALKIFQDRLLEKEFIQSLGLRVAPFIAPNDLIEIEQFVQTRGAILKTRRLGYDGKGQCRLRQQSPLSEIEETLGKEYPLADAVLEEYLDFEAEYSLVGARGVDGRIVLYPLTRNFHSDGIIRLSVPVSPEEPESGTALQTWASVPMKQYSFDSLTRAARECFDRITTSLNYVGVFTIEFFLSNGELIINECAPRVHNSGHWTLSGALFSQFDLHIRAIKGASLPEHIPVTSTVAMLNVISKWPSSDHKTLLQNAQTFDYSKTEREGRKLGHINITMNEFERVLQREEAAELLKYFALQESMFHSDSQTL